MTSTANGKMKFLFRQNTDKLNLSKLFYCLLTRYLTITPRARMGYELIAHDAEGRMGY